MKEDLREYTNQELSLRVFNQEILYKHRNNKDLIETLNIFFIFTEEQLQILIKDLKEDLEEDN